MKLLYKLLTATENETKESICAVLKEKKILYTETDDYIVTRVSGLTPLICTHTDTVSENLPRTSDLLLNKHTLSLKSTATASILGADDRAGVWIALREIQLGTMTRFNYGFFSGEERGAIGSSIFSNETDLLQYSCFIGLDRATKGGVQNIATYGNDNESLIKLFTSFGYSRSYGSFSDCSLLADKSGLACLNLSCGYDFEHSTRECLDVRAMQQTLGVLQDVEVPEKRYFSEWSSTHEEGNLRAVLCDICGSHAPLYEEDDGYWVCSKCSILYHF